MDVMKGKQCSNSHALFVNYCIEYMHLTPATFNVLIFFVLSIIKLYFEAYTYTHTHTHYIYIYE